MAGWCRRSGCFDADFHRFPRMLSDRVLPDGNPAPAGWKEGDWRFCHISESAGWKRQKHFLQIIRLDDAAIFLLAKLMRILKERLLLKPFLNPFRSKYEQIVGERKADINYPGG
jgi:hypothetical protein